MGQISAKDGSASGRKARGIEFGSEARPISFKDIEAVVSEVDLSKFNAKTIKEKLQEDAKWTEKNVKRHHEVIAEANKTSVVIPMKFGMLYKTKKNLETMLAKYYGKFKKLLTRLAGKQEWGVKIYLEYEKFLEFFKKENKEVKKMEESKSAMPEGAQWYADKKIDELIAKESEGEIEKRLQRIVERLEDCCEQTALCDLLPKEATAGMKKDNIFNAACLIDSGKLDCFKKMLQEARKECDQIGAALVVTGPWPPYNFV